MNPGNFPKRKECKRSEAKARQAESDKLTPQQRLAKLDELLGPGVGATKERKRLAVTS